MNKSLGSLRLISRKGCHLCEDMYQQLNLLKNEFIFELMVIDIDSDAKLLQQYVGDIPVLLSGDVEICRHYLDKAKLANHLLSSKDNN